MSIISARSVLLSLVLLVPVAGAACQGETVSGEEPTPGSVMEAAVQQPSPTPTTTVPLPYPPGGIPTIDTCDVDSGGQPVHAPLRGEVAKNEMGHNALSQSALMTDPALLGVLRNNPLSGAVLSAQMLPGTFWNTGFSKGMVFRRPSLSNTLMKYIVSCALDSTASVTYTSGLSSATWPGELGLCSKGSAAGDWSASAPTDQCLELVSACLMARVNAYGRRVPLSLRGEPSCVLPVRKQVQVETVYQDETAPHSFSPCTGAAVGGGGHNQCGWTPGYIGRCVQGESVTVTLPGGQSCAGTSARVCSGLYGCDSTKPGIIAVEPAAPFPPPTVALLVGNPGFVDEVDESCNALSGQTNEQTLTFTCPQNGPSFVDASGATKYHGYYSLMTASASSVPISVSGGSNHYPATEEEIFTFREGAFYGNVFGAAGAVNPAASSTGLNQGFACYSDIWADGADYVAHRACAGADGSCFPNPPAACHQLNATASAYTVCAHDHLMSSASEPWSDYDDCKGGPASAHTWLNPISVFLYQPCDLVSSGGNTNCKLIPGAPGGAPPIPQLPPGDPGQY